jgi:hypothetical protein
MRGQIRQVSLARRVVIDLMHASMDVPLVSVRRRLAIPRLAAARAAATQRPAWAAIFAKAFGRMAQAQPLFRTSYIKWPLAHFYELPKTVAMLVVAPDAVDNGVLLQKIVAPESLALREMDIELRRAKTAPIDQTPFFRKTMRVTRLPLPIRRLAWKLALNIGRQRANYFGTVLITSVAMAGGGAGMTLSPGPFIICYDRVTEDGGIEVLLEWDHRITDAGVIGRALFDLERILDGPIADEILAATAVQGTPGIGAATAQASARIGS